jgi:hypothetical protein
LKLFQGTIGTTPPPEKKVATVLEKPADWGFIVFKGIHSYRRGKRLNVKDFEIIFGKYTDTHLAFLDVKSYKITAQNLAGISLILGSAAPIAIALNGLTPLSLVSSSIGVLVVLPIAYLLSIKGEKEFQAIAVRYNELQKKELSDK